MCQALDVMAAFRHNSRLSIVPEDGTPEESLSRCRFCASTGSTYSCSFMQYNFERCFIRTISQHLDLHSTLFFPPSPPCMLHN